MTQHSNAFSANSYNIPVLLISWLFIVTTAVTHSLY